MDEIRKLLLQKEVRNVRPETISFYKHLNDSRYLFVKGGVMSKKSIIYIIMALVVFMAISVSLFPVSRAEAEKITIKAISAWPKNEPSVADDYLGFIKRANEMLKQKFPGQVEIKYMGGAEVIPIPDQAEALRAGTVDMYFGTDAYYAGIAPEANASKLTRLTSWEERQKGVNAIFDEIHRQKLNSTYLGRLGSEVPFQLYLNKKVTSPADLKGLRIRVSPMYIDFLNALGATPIVTKPGDIYQSLERGVVDGYCWPIFTIRPWGWQEVTKYVVGPSFYKVCHPLLVNLDKWKQIPADIQKALLDIEMKEEHVVAERDMVKMKKERELLKKAGLQFIEFSKSDTKKYFDLAYSSGWEAQIKKAPEYSQKLRKLISK
jgi:TRAP-type C4-dicarboxylate transport system substrate-binding protein